MKYQIIHHVQFRDGKWTVQNCNGGRVFMRKIDAIEAARRLARSKDQIVVHGRHGQVLRSFGYGSGPLPREIYAAVAEALGIKV
jgi:hypothetical protein